jgi:cytochrome c5
MYFKKYISSQYGIHYITYGFFGRFKQSFAARIVCPWFYQEHTQRKEDKRMKKIPDCRWAVMFIFLVIVFLWASGAGGDELQKGKDLYAAKCQICHGTNGRGDGPAAAAFTPKPADFTNPSFWKNNFEEKITNTVTKGKGQMPAFHLKPDEIKAVIDYLEHAFKK